VALKIDRERAGREASPTAGVIDSQTIKAPMAVTRGYDAGKKVGCPHEAEANVTVAVGRNVRAAGRRGSAPRKRR
jgi:hypothetical protein